MKNDGSRGLILGKFAPFHQGHQYLIETALEEVDELIVLLYDCPDIINIPVNVRAGWVRRLYPGVDVIEGWDAPNEHADTLEIRKKQEDYVGGFLDGKKITHFFSSEYYGEHMSEYLGAINRVVDMDRNKYKISATMIRKDYGEHKNFLAPYVIEDLVLKIAFLGWPSVANSDFIREQSLLFNGLYVANNYTGVETETDYLEKAKEKIKERSDKKIFHMTDNYLFYDGACIVDYALNILINRKFDKELMEIAYAEVKKYDMIFIYGDMDGRFQIRSFLMRQLICNLEAAGVRYQILEDGFDEGAKQIRQYLNNLKWNN